MYCGAILRAGCVAATVSLMFLLMDHVRFVECVGDFAIVYYKSATQPTVFVISSCETRGKALYSGAFLSAGCAAATIVKNKQESRLRSKDNRLL